MQTIAKKIEQTYDTLKNEFGYQNVMQAPQIKKVVVSVGTGSMKDKKKVELVADRLAKITGQKPSPRGAKKSIATFKTRQGDIVGFQVTLRGKRAVSFVEKLLHVVLPRTRDFRGVTRKADAVGNYTLGIREHIIFPEASDEELRDIFGLAITIVTSAKTAPEALRFMEHIGMPFVKTA